MQVLDAVTLDTLGQWEPKSTWMAVQHPHTQSIAIGAQDKCVYAVDAMTLQTTHQFDGHTDFVRAVDWLDEHTVVSGGFDSKVFMYALVYTIACDSGFSSWSVTVSVFASMYVPLSLQVGSTLASGRLFATVRHRSCV